MMKNIFYRIIRRRHYWRHVTFSEIAELYMSRVLRVIGINVASGFAAVYLYQIGYSLIFITLMFAFYFLFKVFIMRFVASYAAYFGPKHGILLSNILYIPAMLALGFIDHFGIITILIWLLSLALSTSLYQVCYYIDFSKIKSLQHAGKEIGFMNVFEKLAVGISPIIGGFIALIFGPQTVMFVGALVFLLSAIPLLKTAEQTATRQKISLRYFPWRMARRSLISRMGVGLDYSATIYGWSMFIAIIIFSDLGNSVYLILGTLSSVTVLVAAFTSYIYGRIIDRNRGGELLKYSVIANSIVHIFRSFVGSPVSVVGTNIANEVTTSGIQMPYLRGMFDTADMSGNRIVYLSATESFNNLGAAIGCFILAIYVSLFGDGDGLRIFFITIGFASLIIATAKFHIYRK